MNCNISILFFSQNNRNNKKLSQKREEKKAKKKELEKVRDELLASIKEEKVNEQKLTLEINQISKELYQQGKDQTELREELGHLRQRQVLLDSYSKKMEKKNFYFQEIQRELNQIS